MSLYVAWTLLCAALVLFMTPGLAFFYGGLVKSKSVVSMMMLSFGSIVTVAILYVLIGAGIQGSDEGSKYFGNPFDDFGMASLSDAAGGAGFEPANITDLYEGGSFADHAFLVAFCIITVALVSGAVADRARFWPWILFAALFATLVVFPTFRWIWGPDAWLADNVFGFGGALDWAGGTVIHQSAGAAALALALVLGKRVGFSKELAVSHNVPLVLIGASILWFGWFGFNTGVYGDNLDHTGLIFLNTLITPAAAVIGWLVVETLKDGKPTAVGAASGIVAGLVAITPACAYLTPIWAIVLGVVAGAVCACAIDLKFTLGFDDSLDVVGLHLVAGFIGCAYVGLFGSVGGAESLFFGGSIELLGAQVLSSLFVIGFSFVVTYVIGRAIEKSIGFRVKEEDEIAGIDQVLHGEGYALD